MEQAVNNIAECKNEHQEISSKYRYNPEMTTHLGSIINPVILKLTKEEDSVGMGNLGPIYSPPHYCFFFFFTVIKLFFNILNELKKTGTSCSILGILNKDLSFI